MKFQNPSIHSSKVLHQSVQCKNAKNDKGPLLKQYFSEFIQKLIRSFNYRNQSIPQIFFFFFFFFFLIWVLRPFQEYFTYIEPIVHRRWAKTGEPGEKPPDHP